MVDASNNVNFMALMNPEFAAKQLAFQQQQAIAQQMMQEGSLQPDTAQLANPGGLVVPNSPWAAAARSSEKMLGAYMQKKNNEDMLKAYQGLAGGGQGAPGQAQTLTPAQRQGVMMSDPAFMQNAAISGVDNATKVWLAQNSPTDLMKNASNPATEPYIAKDKLTTGVGGVPTPVKVINDRWNQQPNQPQMPSAQPLVDNKKMTAPQQVDAVSQLFTPANPDNTPTNNPPASAIPQLNAAPNPQDHPYDPINPVANKANEETGTQAAKSGSDYQNKIIDESSHALEGKRIMGQMTENLKGFEPGKLATAKSDLSAWAQALGFDKNTLDAQLGSVGDVQSFNKLTAQLAIQAIKQISPRATQMEFEKFLENNPNVELNPDSMKTLMDYTTKTFDLPLQKQAEFSKWKKSNPLSNYADFDSEWNNKINSDIGSTIATKPAESAPKVIKYDASGKRVQ